MNFDLSPEQDMFCSSVERFCAPIDVEARRKMRRSPHGYERARWAELAEMGLIALAVPEAAGGLGGSAVDLALVGEALGRANALDPWLENAVVPAQLLAQSGAPSGAGGDPRAHDCLAQVVSGERMIAFAWAERGQRYSLNAQDVTAVNEGRTDGGADGGTDGGVVLSGEKTFVMGAAGADGFIVTACCEGATRCYLVNRGGEGVELRPYRLADGSIAGELKLTRAPAHMLDLDAAAMGRVISAARLYAAAEMVGLGQLLLDDTLAYVKQREQFGVAIGSFQALQHRLVECYVRIEQSRSMLLRAALAQRPDNVAQAEHLDQEQEWQRGVAGAKAFIGENVDAVAREAVQMHGGMGITDELAIGHALKRVMVLNKLFGDVDGALADYAKAA